MLEHLIQALREENERMHAEQAKRHVIYIAELPESQKTARLLFAVLNRMEQEQHHAAAFQRDAFKKLYERLEMNPALAPIETALADLKTDISTKLTGLQNANTALQTDKDALTKTNTDLQTQVTNLQAQIDSGAHLADDVNTIVGEIGDVKTVVDGPATPPADTTGGAAAVDPVTGLTVQATA